MSGFKTKVSCNISSSNYVLSIMLSNYHTKLSLNNSQFGLFIDVFVFFSDQLSVAAILK